MTGREPPRPWQRITSRAGRPARLPRTEREARAAIGMPAGHPERITPQPSHAERRRLYARSAELWPDEEYTAIIRDTPPGGLVTATIPEMPVPGRPIAFGGHPCSRPACPYCLPGRASEDRRLA